VQPDFDQTPWDEDVNSNFAILDATYGKFIGVEDLTGAWRNAAAYSVGQTAVDAIDSTLWKCGVAHTSANSPTTFAQDRTAHPSYWISNGALSIYLPLTGGTLTGTLGIAQPAGMPCEIVGGTTGIHVNWIILPGNSVAQSGSSTGADFEIMRFSDANAYIDSPLYIARSNGIVSVNTELLVTGSVTTGAALHLPNSAYITSTATATYFVQDAANWRWQYERASGTMHWIQGALNIPLFSIDGSGNVIAKGTITASGSPVVTEARIAELEARIAALEAKV
jgi:hypothetical protein